MQVLNTVIPAWTAYDMSPAHRDVERGRYAPSPFPLRADERAVEAALDIGEESTLRTPSLHRDASIKGMHEIDV